MSGDDRASRNLLPGQRAALLLRERTGAGPSQQATHRELGDAGVRALADRYATAWEAGEVDTIVAVLTDDARYAMPPEPAWFAGRAAIREFLTTGPLTARWRFRPARANGQLAFATYLWDEPGWAWVLGGLDVLTLRGDRIAEVVSFLDPAVFTPEELAEHPQRRLRISFGLREQDGHWLVAHEHHSFTDTTSPEPAEPAIRELHRRWYDGTAAGDLDAIMAGIADDVVSYEHEQPLRFVGADQVREVCRRGLESSPGAVSWEVPDLRVVVDGDLAVAWGLNLVRADGADDWSRGTRVFQRRGGEWRMTHQHVSYPFDPATGRARTDLVPDGPGPAQG